MAGEAYRQEFSLANAEDVNEVLSTTYEFGDHRELDRFVPPRLAQLFCSGDCVVTSDFSAPRASTTHPRSVSSSR